MLGHDIRRTLALAWPVMINRAGALFMITADTIMTGRHSAQELAFYSLGLAPQIIMLVCGIGLLQGTVILIAQAEGAGESEICGGIWRLALFHAFVYALVMLIPALFAENFFLAIGQSPTLAEGGAAVLRVFVVGMAPLMMLIACAFFLEATGHPRVGMVVILIGNAVNIALNSWLIGGGGPVPALGGMGAALATALTRWAMLAGAVGYILFAMRDRHKYGVWTPLPDRAHKARTFRRLGVPMAMAQTLESATVTTLMLFAGLLGAQSLAAYQAVHNLVAVAFMISLGLGAATAIRVGNAVGRADPLGIRRAGWVGVALTAAITSVIAAGYYLFSDAIAALYINDPAVIAIAAPAIALVALVPVFDGIQGVMMAALRGVGDVWPVTALQMVSFWGVAVPTAWWLCFHQAMGVAGLVWGLVAGVVAASILLSTRFLIFTRRPIARV